MPSRERNVTSIVLTLYEERGTFWMFDCGEGTQQQVLRSPLRLSKLEKIFITHLHGDHVYGLPGLLTSRSYQGGEKPLTLYGPPGLKRMIDVVLEVSQASLEYELQIEEIGEGLVFEDEQFRVEAARLEHRIDSYGYRIIEKDKPGRLMHEKLREEGVPPGPLYARIKRGERVTLPDGRELDPARYVAPPIPGRVVVIMGDTRVCEGSRRLSRDADVLVHEATYGAAEKKRAHRYFHATADDVAAAARASGVKRLVMTHFSSRYAETGVDSLIAEAKAHLADVYAAHDFWSLPIPRKQPPGPDREATNELSGF
jgi:ribonuclease Z